MREIIAALVIFAASRMIDLKSEEASFISGLAMLVCLVALVFLAAALAERMNPKMKKWYRITPGTKTEMDEEEWNKIGLGAAAAKPMKRTMSPVASPPPAVESIPIAMESPPPESPPPARAGAPVFYDSGFDASAGKKKAEGPDEFDDIFGVDKTENPR